jgi:hypothetical protein
MISIIAGAAVPDDLRVQEARVRFETRDALHSSDRGGKLRLNRSVVGTARDRAHWKRAHRQFRIGRTDSEELDLERCPDAVFAFDPRTISVRCRETRGSLQELTRSRHAGLSERAGTCGLRSRTSDRS